MPFHRLGRASIPWVPPSARILVLVSSREFRNGRDQDKFEIVFVIDGGRLLDQESYERRYRTWHGLPLAKGYYVVHWPERIRDRRFDERARYQGPFRRRGEAVAALKNRIETRCRALAGEAGSIASPGLSWSFANECRADDRIEFSGAFFGPEKLARTGSDEVRVEP